MNPNSSQTFPKREERITLTNLFFEVSITLILKTDEKNYMKRKWLSSHEKRKRAFFYFEPKTKLKRD